MSQLSTTIGRSIGWSLGGAFVLTASVDAATTLYVNGSCGDDNWTGASPACSSPDGPKATIGAGIATSLDGDEILVAPGVYTGLINFNGKAVALRSTDGPDTTFLDGQDAGRVVVCVSGEGPATVLEGFTVTGGYASLGGGMYNLGSSPTVRGCIFTNNYGEVGGAMRNQHGSHPLIEDCLFLDNTGAPAGAAMVNSEGHPTIVNCVFIENDSPLGPGAVGNLNEDGGSPLFVNCRFALNDGGANGGGAVDGGSTTWINCVFSRNTSGGPLPGGGMAATNSPTIINCTFSGNMPHGIATQGVDTVQILNSIVWGNAFGALSVPMTGILR